MIKKRYVCGYDFGTLSCRILVLDLQTGEKVFEKGEDYSDGVITDKLLDSEVGLAHNWCLQNPDNYIDVMRKLTHEATQIIDPESIVAIGTDFTNCTVVALGENGKPLCTKSSYTQNPHAWVKLWKHHSSQPYAERIAKYLENSGVEWYGEYGRNVSSEWIFPKILQVYEEAPEIYEKTDVFLEAADYIVYFLTGKLVRNSATLGVNAFYNQQRGFPDKDFFNDVSVGWGESVLHKMKGDIKPVGSRVGKLSKEAAEFLGLSIDTIVAVGHGDSEVAAAGLGINESGSMLMVMGTSTCYQMMHNENKEFDGVNAIVRDGMIPGLIAYESGQPAVGDSFAWFEENMMPKDYSDEAYRLGVHKLEYMESLAKELKPGEAGLVSLDWFNGNRSVLMNYNLQGVIAGLTLSTKPESVYRSMIEATAFGARKIFDDYNDAGVTIEKVYASGGLAQKSPLTMQIYADVLGIEIIVTSISNASVMGACVCGAVAFHNEVGTLEAFKDISERLVHYKITVYKPEKNGVKIYNELYSVFCKLHDYFGRTSDVCAKLLQIQQNSKIIYNK